MAHLGPGEYAVLLHLSRAGAQPLVVDGSRAIVGDGAEFRAGVVDRLVTSGLVSRADSDDGAAEIELSATGRSRLDQALAQRWVVDHSSIDEDSGTYRFEVADPVTGRRFVVAVSQEAGIDLANRVAYGVIAAASVRESCRKIETLGPDGGFPVKVGVEGAGEIEVWRKL